MANLRGPIEFSALCGFVRDSMIENGSSVEEAVNTFLETNLHVDFNDLEVDFMPTSDVEWSILNVLGASQRIDLLTFGVHAADPFESLIPLVFDRVMPTKKLSLIQAQMSPETAEAIFDRLEASQVSELHVHLPDFDHYLYGQGIMNNLCRLLHDQYPLSWLTLGCEENNPLPEESFLAFCSAVAGSQLEALGFNGLVVATTNHQTIVNALANSIVDCTSLSSFHIDNEDEDNTIVIEDVIQGLARTDRVRNFDLFVTRRGNDVQIELHDLRNPRNPLWTLMYKHLGWWMGIVADDDIPMNHWPEILCAARDGRFHHLATHTPLDIFHFLVRQKCAMLVQTPRQVIAWQYERMVHLERTVALQQQQLAAAEQERDFFMNRHTRLSQLLMNQAAVFAQQAETTAQQAEVMRQMTQMLIAASVSDDVVVAERGGLGEDEKGN